MEPGKYRDKLGNALFGMTPAQAIEKNICIQCNKPPRFKTEAGKKEYQLTGMCEYCFDDEFQEDKL